MSGQWPPQHGGARLASGATRFGQAVATDVGLLSRRHETATLSMVMIILVFL